MRTSMFETLVSVLQ